MKNIQIIDRAENATFSVFQVTDEEFSAIFPADGQDIEFIEDFIARCGGDDQAGIILRPVWERPILKRDANGIHGTLYYEYEDRRRHLPTTKREVDWDEDAINPAQRRLFAGKSTPHFIVEPSRDISRLIQIMAALRTPVTGCPWDLEQNFATIAPYTIEEAYEVVEAISRGDLDDLREELGDLLLQVVFHAQMAEEQNAFAFGDVVEAITRKMIRRHPHVFADKDGNLASSHVKEVWDRIKAEEKAERAARRPPEDAPPHKSLLSGVKAGQPALTRAMELQRKASTVGFDWNDPRAVLQKIREEADEIEAALDRNDKQEIAEETGDLMFALVNLARHVDADPESALRVTNAKFERRFAYIERTLEAQGRTLEQASLAEMDALWNAAKGEEKPSHAAERSNKALG